MLSVLSRFASANVSFCADEQARRPVLYAAGGPEGGSNCVFACFEGLTVLSTALQKITTSPAKT